MSMIIQRLNGTQYEILDGRRRLTAMLETFGKAQITDRDNGLPFTVRQVDDRIMEVAEDAMQVISAPIEISPTRALGLKQP